MPQCLPIQHQGHPKRHEPNKDTCLHAKSVDIAHCANPLRHAVEKAESYQVLQTVDEQERIHVDGQVAVGDIGQRGDGHERKADRDEAVAEEPEK